MQILHLSISDLRGGAARAAYRLHTGLCQIGHDSRMLVAEKASRDPNVMMFSQSWISPLWRRLRYRQLAPKHWRYVLSRPEGYGPFTGPDSRQSMALIRDVPEADVLNLHRIADLLDHPRFLSTATERAPVIWTQHDMNAFTGGCAYSRGCDAFERSCGACPQLGSDNPQDLSHQYWRIRETLYRSMPRGRLHIVTPSSWMAREVAHSSLMSSLPVSVIPNSLDVQVFAPRDRLESRNRLRIPPSAKVVLFSAASVTAKRKGFALLAEALGDLNSVDNLVLMSIGKGKPAIESAVPHLHIGSTSDDQLLAEVYSSADVFAIPSLQDNLPNTVMESLACGTPVVGFAVGGIPEMVRPGETGLLAPPFDVATLRASIIQILQDVAGQAAMRTRCRSVAVKEYSLEIQARRYAALYEDLLRSARKSDSEGARP